MDNTAIAASPFTEDVGIFEYSRAVNPIASGSVPKIPYREFNADLYASGQTRTIPLDISSDLRCPSPAASATLRRPSSPEIPVPR